MAFHYTCTWYVCIDIVEIGIADGQISSIFDRVICPSHDSDGVLLFHVFMSPHYRMGRHIVFPTV